MFAYCLNSPVSYTDKAGQDADAAQYWAGTMWWLCGADGLLPVGDIIYIVVLMAFGTYAALTNPVPLFPQIYTNADKSEPEPPDVEYPGDDPTKAPEGYTWRGPDAQGGARGGYANPDGDDSWHPDLEHPDGVGPHWDYNDGHGNKWRVYPDNSIEHVRKK